MQQQRSIKYLVVLFGWFLLMSYSLFTPAKHLSAPSNINFPGADKVVHFVLFAVLTYLTVKTVKMRNIKISKFQLGCLLALYAVITELVQIGISGRHGDFWDFLADVLGVTAVLIFIKI